MPVQAQGSLRLASDGKTGSPARTALRHPIGYTVKVFGSSVVRQLRRLVGLSQRELAGVGGTSQSTLSAYERGDKSPTLETLDRLSASVGLIPVVSFVPSPARVIASLRDRFSPVPGVEEIWIFGSFVRLAEGDRAVAPNDIDVLVVGTPSRAEAGKAARLADQDIGFHVDLAVLPRAEWQGPSGFVRTVRQRPMLRAL